MAEKKAPVLAIAGNPNSGKTTLFNALTGSSQRTGNWPGVTVEKKSGSLESSGERVSVVDLPGIYSLSCHSEDERVARDYLLSGEARAVLNIVDASNLERNLFLTLNLIEMRVPVVVALNMVDLAAKKGVAVDPQALSAALGVPVVALSATVREDVRSLKDRLFSLIDSAAVSKAAVSYPEAVEQTLSAWAGTLEPLARDLAVDSRWFALKVLERDEYLSSKAFSVGALDSAGVNAEISRIETALGDSPDAVIASAKYGFIAEAAGAAKREASGGASSPPFGERLDRLVLHRALGIPVFLLVMYLMFWTVMNVGGAFIDFFDILFGAVFVDGFGALLSSLGSPEWLTAILAGGIGAGIQTVSTFVPIVFFMFLILSLLEDSGYMARAAFVMDRALRAVGLPGKAFIPMIVGFGCTVPAVMATRTLENKRDRYIAVFMVPFMSCGARLPVYALFGAAFFGARSGLIVLSLYLAGVVLSVFTGFMLKNTLFRGEPAPFVMELPPWHLPKLSGVMRYTWMRLKSFVIRAGKVITAVVAVLAVLNSLGTDGSFGNEDSQASVLTALGKGVASVFAPMGLREENWPAAVGMFTGLFAKEAVVGTLNGLYAQMAALEGAAAPEEGNGDSGEDSSGFPEDAEEPWSLTASAAEALASIPEALSGLGSSVLDPLGLAVVSGDEEATAEEVEADSSIFGSMRRYFADDLHAVYAYLLFILIYFPCFAALGAIVRELGSLFGFVAVAYLTVLAWITSTLYYQIAAGHNPFWIAFALALLALVFAAFRALRGKAVTATAEGPASTAEGPAV